MVQRVMMIAGEASGDLHGAGVVRELRRRVPTLDLFGVGGENMRKEGMEAVVRSEELAVMGFVEVLRHLGTIRAVEKRLVGLLATRRPDVVVLIDYPGFNLRFARRVKEQGIPLLYYISPQVWAWNRKRVRTIKRLVDRMRVVFPFEVPIYAEEGMDVQCVGHPIVERIGAFTNRDEFFRRHGLDPAKRLVGLFPGSRVQEIERILPAMLRAAVMIRQTTDVQTAVSVAPNLGRGTLAQFLTMDPATVPIERGTHELMQHADAAVVTSGTATLETGWFGTPMVVVYRTSPVTYLIGRLLVRVPYIGLVNIVAGKKVVPELIQGAMTPSCIADEVRHILSDDTYRDTMRRELGVIKTALGEPGASARVAADILAMGEAA